MSQPATQATFAPVNDGPYIVRTPLWCTIVRGFTIFFAFVIIILAGVLIHGAALDANVFGLVCVCDPSATSPCPPFPPPPPGGGCSCSWM